jgi:hypothetical protein
MLMDLRLDSKLFYAADVRPAVDDCPKNDRREVSIGPIRSSMASLDDLCYARQA